jgi:hypothetical protein
MQYMLIQYTPTEKMAGSAPDGGVPDGAAWEAYTQMLIETGVMRGGNGLHPGHTATTIKLHDGKATIQDGPFIDSKDQLGGYYVIETETLDKALELAAKSPAAQSGAVEVRPIFTQ